MFVVADLGGTTLRIGRYSGEGEPGTVTEVCRVRTDGIDRFPGEPASRPQRRALDQLIGQLTAYLRSSGGSGALAVGLSFAGPVTAGGTAISAATIWGEGGDPVPVGPLLEVALGLPVVVVNDMTAAAWRYAAAEPEPFCLFTISSGIGNKVFRKGEVLIDDAGHGGELGHWRVDPSPDAPRCDCGARGHLAAIASGRGVLAATQRAAAGTPARFRRSMLVEAAGGDPDAITNEALAAAVRAGDPFATEMLRGALASLATAVSGVFAAIGVRRYLFIGGFATAVGHRFIDILGDELVRLGCFGLPPEQVRAMLALGAPDDDHGLIGIGRMLTHQR